MLRKHFTFSKRCKEKFFTLPSPHYTHTNTHTNIPKPSMCATKRFIRCRYSLFCNFQKRSALYFCFLIFMLFLCFRRCQIYKRLLFIFNIFTVALSLSFSLYYAWPLLTRLLSNQHHHGKSFFKKIDGFGTDQRRTHTPKCTKRTDISQRRMKKKTSRSGARISSASHADSPNTFHRIDAKHVIY